MFSKIMVPVDLVHKGSLGRALEFAADLAQRHKAEIVYVGVTAGTPGPVAHNPREFRDALDAFVADQAREHGVRASGQVVETHDPAVDMNKALIKTIDDTGADCVVMQSHAPGLSDYVFEGHGAYLAQHAKTSVMLVRD